MFKFFLKRFCCLKMASILSWLYSDVWDEGSGWTEMLLYPKWKKTFLLRVLLCWRMQCGGGHSHFCLLYLYCFSLNRHKNRKTALLNLLSVKGFLGISSMWRKIRVSLELLPSGCSQRLPTLPGVSSVLIRDARLVEAALRLQKRKKKGGEEGDSYWGTQISCPVSRSGFMHGQVSRIVALCSMNSYRIIFTLLTSYSRWAVGAQKLRGICWIRLALDLPPLSLKPSPIHWLC